VPTTSPAINAAKRTPSVPDLAMYSRQHSATSTTATAYVNITNAGDGSDKGIVYPMNSTTLSEAMLRKNESGNAKDHLEERLRRAELQLSPDFSNDSAARYRSKSTPSRWAHSKRVAKGENSTDSSRAKFSGDNIPVNLDTVDDGDNIDQGYALRINGYNNESYQTQQNISNGVILNDESTSAASSKNLNSSVHAKSSPVGRGNSASETTSQTCCPSQILGSSLPAVSPAVVMTRKSEFNLETMNDRSSNTNISLRASNASEDFFLETPIIASNHSIQGEKDSALHISPSHLAADIESHNSINGNFSERSSDVSLGSGSRNSRDLSVTLDEDTRIPAPPPPPPPASEKERLVERERQARSETERARRRHIALLRERHLDDVVADDAGIEDEILIGQISFDDGTNGLLRDHILDVEAETGGIHAQSAPRFIGVNSAAISTLPYASSSVAGSDISIPRPPLPPPPATERERLVERERQARLETERARRRQALLRERQADLNDSNDYDGGSNRSRGGSNASSSDDNGIFQNVSRIIPEVPSSEGQSHDAEAGGLSYTMERFLENLGEEETGDIIPIEVSDDSELSQIRMELFLAENVALNETHRAGHHIDGGNEGGSSPPPSRVSRSSFNANVDSHLEPHMHSIDENNPNPDIFSGTGGVGGVRSTHNIHADRIPPRNEVFERTEQMPSISFEDTTERNDFNVTPLQSTEEPDNIIPNTTPLDDRVFSTDAEVTEVLSLQESSNANSPPDTSYLLRQLVESSNEIISTDTIHNEHVTENTQGLSSTSSRQSTARSQDSITTNPAASRRGGGFPQLTEAGIAHLDEVEQASTGNAPPNSYRDEPSDLSVIGRNFLDNAFSVATQTTVIESVTETSVDGRSEDEQNQCNRTSDGSNIIRVDSVVTRSSGARSASIQAMPSSDSESTSSRDISTSSDESSRRSNDVQYPIPMLTEADVEAMVEIENASIGNAPPHSVRDDHLSESSVIGHSSQIETDNELRSGHRATATPLSDLESLDEDSLPSNLGAQIRLRSSSDVGDSFNGQSQFGGGASVEAMPSDRSDHNSSRHSAEGLLSQQREISMQDEFHGSDDEDMIVYQASDMASSTSIEALPDLEYGAINESVADECNLGPVVIDIGAKNDERAQEMTPLLSSIRTFGENISPFNETNGQVKEEGSIDYTVKMYPIIIQLVAELPAIMFVLEYGTVLCTLVGMRRYQMIIASLVVLISIFTQYNHQSFCMYQDSICGNLRQTSSRRILSKQTFVFVSIGCLFGVIACVCTGFDFLFGGITACSIFVALVSSSICGFVLAWAIGFINHGAKVELVIPIFAASQDVIRCIVFFQFSHLLSSAVGPMGIEVDDIC